MGYDLSGIKAKNEKGEYFHNNIWWWGSLREYVLEFAADSLGDEEKESWYYNDGNVITEETAVDIGNTLLSLINEGHTEAHEELFSKIFDCPFTVENVQNFAEFCINSGGFDIC